MTFFNNSIVALIKRIRFKYYWPRLFFESLGIAVSNTKNFSPTYRLGICTIIKNEGEYIEEWVRYHLYIGADIIYIYDNDSDDDTHHKLLPYINRGDVEYIRINGHGRQLDAYNDCVCRHRYDCKYIAFIDADEFLFKLDYNSDIVAIIDKIISLDKKAGGIAVNWRMFGSSGLQKKPEGGVLRNFLFRAKEDGKGNNCIKTIVNPRVTFEFHSPHFPIYFKPYYSISEKGERVDGWSYRNDNIQLLRINHYFTKSKEEWIRRRRLGKADSYSLNNSRSIQEFYEHDNNDVYDPSILTYVQAFDQYDLEHR